MLASMAFKCDDSVVRTAAVNVEKPALRIGPNEAKSSRIFLFGNSAIKPLTVCVPR
jgi:hypothetical protein